MDYISQPVVIEDTAPSEHLDAVAQAFASAGFDVEVVADYGRRSMDLLPWVVLVDLLVPVRPFFNAFFTEAGKDAYASVKKWLRDVSAARAGAGTGEGAIQLRDPEHTNVILPSALPDEAIDALRDLDWDEVRGDYLVWDGQRKIWRDPTKRESSG
jgi:hypothetical protein